MDPTQISSLRDDLQGIVRGELLFDDLSRVLYASDASLFEVRPAAVVVPRDEEDLCALVRYAGENQIPLVPRGAGSGLAGEALGSGLVVDLSIYFRAITRIGETTAEVEPGVTLTQLNARPVRSCCRSPMRTTTGARPAPCAGIRCSSTSKFAWRAGIQRPRIVSLSRRRCWARWDNLRRCPDR